MTRPRTSPHLCPPATLRPLRRRAGFSVAEMVIVITIIGILSGMVIIMVQGSYAASKEALAKSRLEMLNSALHTWSTANREMYFPPSSASSTDEFVVLRDLQFRDPDPLRARIGAPYLPPEYNPGKSSDEGDFRFRWNGRLFELVPAGQPGTGLRMDFDAADFTKPFDFPDNYQYGSR